MNKEERYDIAKDIAEINRKLRTLDTSKGELCTVLMKSLCRLAEPSELYEDGLKAMVVKPTQLIRDNQAYAKLAKSLGFKNAAAFDMKIETCLVRVPATEYVKVMG